MASLEPDHDVFISFSSQDSDKAEAVCERLEAEGLSVEVGDRAAEATGLNLAFFHYIQTGRPFVTAKWAMTLDGRIATHTGVITGG